MATLRWPVHSPAKQKKSPLKQRAEDYFLGGE
jgi:hypothetical protein